MLASDPQVVFLQHITQWYYVILFNDSMSSYIYISSSQLNLTHLISAHFICIMSAHFVQSMQFDSIPSHVAACRYDYCILVLLWLVATYDANHGHQKSEPLQWLLSFGAFALGSLGQLVWSFDFIWFLAVPLKLGSIYVLLLILLRPLLWLLRPLLPLLLAISATTTVTTAATVTYCCCYDDYSASTSSTSTSTSTSTCSATTSSTSASAASTSSTTTSATSTCAVL